VRKVTTGMEGTQPQKMRWGRGSTELTLGWRLPYSPDTSERVHGDTDLSRGLEGLRNEMLTLGLTRSVQLSRHLLSNCCAPDS
jgi:hypothetical protein